MVCFEKGQGKKSIKEILDGEPETMSKRRLTAEELEEKMNDPDFLNGVYFQLIRSEQVRKEYIRVHFGLPGHTYKLPENNQAEVKK